MDINKKQTKQKRLRILGEDELENIYGRPRFTYEERCNYFSLSQPEKDLLNVLRSIKSRAYSKLDDMGSIDKFTRLKHQQMILDLFKYHKSDPKI